MNILIVYNFDTTEGIRNTLLESVFCFRDYGDIHFYYYNYDVRMGKMLSFMRRIKFDAVLFHYSFMCDMRWGEKDKYEKVLSGFKNCWPAAVKGIIPQDEYYMTSRIRKFIQEAGIDIVYTLASGKDKAVLYTNYFNNLKVYTVLTGYVEERTIQTIKKLEKECKGKEREFQVGYRARNLSFALGAHGNLKVKIAEEFNKRLTDNSLKANIKNTSDDKNVFWGNDWYRFLLNCDTVLGCMGGASILDADGKIASMVLQYHQSHPNANFEEAAAQILSPYEDSICYKMISPRIFEAAMTKTCQVLAEGDYKVIKPGIHYISFKPDFSDFDEVIKKIQDKEYCKAIAENAYQELIQSGKYSYQRYVRNVVRTLKKEKKEGKQYHLGYIKAVLSGYNTILSWYNRLYKVWVSRGWIVK